MSKKTTEPASTEKQFSLKEIELNAIQNLHTRANQALFDFLAFIAIERLAYNVDNYTTFRVEDGKLYIDQVEPPKEEAAPAEVSVA